MVKILPRISLNQLAEYSGASSRRRQRIIEQQQAVNPFLIPWYQTTKSGLRKFFSDVKNVQPLLDAMARLRARVPSNKRQELDRQVSIEALEKVISMNFSKRFGGITYEAVKPNVRTIDIANVTIGVSPEIIIRAEVRGRIVYGGIKVHLCKGKPFSHDQCGIVATGVYEYIDKQIKKDGEFVQPEYCMCLDVFGDRIVSAQNIHKDVANVIEELCKEIHRNWAA